MLYFIKRTKNIISRKMVILFTYTLMFNTMMNLKSTQMYISRALSLEKIFNIFIELLM